MHIIYVHSSKTQISNGLSNDNFLFTEYRQDYNLLLFLLITFLAVSVNSGPAEVIRPVRFWPDYIFTQNKQKKVPCRLQSLLYDMAGKVIKLQ